MIRVRTRAALSCSCQDIWKASATQEKPRSSSARPIPGDGTVKCTRMKNRPSGLSPYCWLARMFPECCTRKLDTAYTMPGLSGQKSVSTYSRPRAASIFPPSCCVLSNPYRDMQQSCASVRLPVKCGGGAPAFSALGGPLGTVGGALGGPLGTVGGKRGATDPLAGVAAGGQGWR